MNKAAIYIALLFASTGILDLVTTYSKHHDIVLQDKGLQFADVDIQNIVLWPQKNDVFIIDDKSRNETSTYKVNSHYSGSGPQNILLFKSNLGERSYDQLIIDAVQGGLDFQDTLSLTYEDRVNLFSHTDDFKGKRLLQQENKSFFWKMMDSAFIVSPFLVVLSLVTFWLIDGIIGFTNKFSKKDLGQVIKHTFITIFIVLFFVATYDGQKYSASWVSAFLRILLIVLPVYIALQYAIKKYLPKKDLPDQEMVKFVILYLGTGLTLVISVAIARWVDNHFFNASPFMAMHVINPIQLMIYFAFAIATGNLLNNLRKYYISLNSTKKQLHYSQQEVLASQAELNALQASVNPHFLYNSLNSIASLAQIDPAKTEQMALSLSSFYKYTTNRQDEHLCTLEEEVNMLETYLNIEKIRFGERLIYHIQCPAETLSHKVPRFLLQPLVENAIKYGYNKNNNKIEININSKITDDQLILKIFDNGSPFSDDMKSGYGLRSITKKLKLLFPVKHNIEFINEPQKHVFISIARIL
ncbi:MAG: histidine kinase [Saprospiraceae bacterium]